MNSDDLKYGGSGVQVEVQFGEGIPSHGRAHSISFQMPPLCVLVIEGRRELTQAGLLKKAKSKSLSKGKGKK